MSLDKTELSKLLEVATVAARLGGQRAMEEINYTKSMLKDGNEIVTQADRICQKIIIDQIKQYYPDHGFIGEEDSDSSLYKQNPRTEDIWWVIDPIDGTNNYATGIYNFSVSIGIIHNGFPVIGVIFDPSSELMFTATSESEALLNGKRIKVSETTPNENAGFAIDSYWPDGIPTQIQKFISECRFRNFGTTAMHMAYVANGGFFACITNNPKLWDITAGYCIVKQAGGITTYWDGKDIFPVKPAEYNKEPFKILVSNKASHKILTKTLV